MSHVGRTGLLSYNSSKHALLGLTRAPYPNPDPNLNPNPNPNPNTNPNQVSVDTLSWEFPIVSMEEKDVAAPPKDGAYVKGLFLEGAGWNW